jgi:HAD superfamily hydrolase (TIGR01509 family)
VNAFIFDFDGVIVDSEFYWKTMGDEVFFPSLIPGWTKDDGAKMMGLGVKTGYELLQKDYGLTLSFDAYWAALDDCVGNIYTHKAAMLPGLEALLERLKQMKIPLGIASSSQRHWIDPTLKRLHIDHYFSAVCGANDVNERTKPLPDVYLLAAEKLGADPRSSVALEDSTNGLLAAKNAGMKCVCIRTGMNPEQDLTKADLLIKHYDELTNEVLGGL